MGTPVTFTEPSAFSWLEMLLKSAVPDWVSLRYRYFSVSGWLAVNPAVASRDLALSWLYGYGL